MNLDITQNLLKCLIIIIINNNNNNNNNADDYDNSSSHRYVEGRDRILDNMH